MTQMPAAADHAPPPRAAARINKIDSADLRTALIDGWCDFAAEPQYGLFFGLLYGAAGWSIILLAAVSGYYYLAFPLAAGFALIAPFIAVGLYEVSRRREAGLAVSWSDVSGAMTGSGKRDLGWMALVTAFSFFIWIDIAILIYAMFYGFTVPGLWALAADIVTTRHGLLFFATGNLVGACFAWFMFTISVVSFPMLLDRDVDFVTAMLTSARAVRKNRTTMLVWALIIAVFLALSIATAFAGLILVLPWLAHASWHIYRSVIAPGAE